MRLKLCKILLTAAVGVILVLTFLFYQSEKILSLPIANGSTVIASLGEISNLENGKWIRCFRGPDGAIYLRKFLKSSDGGKTFGKQNAVDVEDINAAPERAVLASKEQFFAMAGYAKPVGNGFYQVDAWRSADGLKTLDKETSMIHVPEGPKSEKKDDEWYGLFIYRTIIEMPDGSWLMSMYGNFDQDRIHPADGNAQREVKFMMRTFIVTSQDKGRTWSYLSNVAVPHSGDPVGEGFVEPAITLLDDGRLLCVMRTGHHYPLYASWSSDDGKTWTPPLYTGLDRGCDPCLLKLEDGRVALSWGRRFSEGWSKITPAGDHGDFKYPGYGFTNLAISDDGGRTWTNTEVARRTGSCYSTIIEVEPGVIFFQVDQWVGHIALNSRKGKIEHERSPNQ
jgi:hypothetical protein